LPRSHAFSSSEQRMTSPELERLVATGALKREPPTTGEVEGLIRSGRARLGDALRADLTLESRFDLAYNAAHSIALAAVRRMGYRSTNRYLVFQVLPHTLGQRPHCRMRDSARGNRRALWKLTSRGRTRRADSQPPARVAGTAPVDPGSAATPTR
jgi:hypothetical protein